MSEETFVFYIDGAGRSQVPSFGTREFAARFCQVLTSMFMAGEIVEKQLAQHFIAQRTVAS